MFGSEILEVAIGVIFVFILVSIICTAVREGIETWLRTRSAYLEHGIRELLQDLDGTGIARHFYEHPMIYGLFSGGYGDGPKTRERPGLFTRGHNLPSYIPSRNFALALMDIAARGPTTNAASSTPGARVLSAESIRANIQNIQNPAVQRVLLTAVDHAQGDMEQARKNVEMWFDSAMDRVSGHYKRSSQKIILGIGLLIAIALNIDTIHLAGYLYRDDAARTVLVARAEAAVEDSAVLRQSYRQAREELDSLQLPIGWARFSIVPEMKQPESGILPWARYVGAWAGNMVMVALGWLITGAAATLGAPFWFDVLNKVMVVRSTVKPHEKSREESSEDRQPKPAQPTPPETLAAAPVAVVAPVATTQPAEDDDAEEHLEGCGAHDEDGYATADEDLPPAEGGVA